MDMMGKTLRIIAVFLCVLSCGKDPQVVSDADAEDNLPEGWYAQGTILWSDRTPASGITVSDGFDVTVTDSKGEYRLTTRPDTRYVYFSYPSDAQITVKSGSGLPAFFTNYEYSRHIYNFELKRGTVEKEFVLFAMADPQAHYKARDTQKSADTDRFANETVPAVNDHIKELKAKGLPCYGITLGDIVYSNESRDSNPGLTIMRDHFKKVDMPVFQIMGNHDFSFLKEGAEIVLDERTTTVNLMAQRKFETCFGPIDYSFNRGDVHIVCMKNVNFKDTGTWSFSYGPGFTDDQLKWLKADLANVPKDKKVILCVHITMAGNFDSPNISAVADLLLQYKDATIFSGHTHHYRGIANVHSTALFEHVHGAVCGKWWWSNIGGDGAPNSYTVYDISGTDIKDAYMMGVNDRMNTRDYQMRIYRGGLKYGGQYGYFQSSLPGNVLKINIFNGDSRWKVQVYENDVLSGDASLMSKSQQKPDISSGQTFTIPSSSSQDWWAIGYHIGVCHRSGTADSYYDNCYHMWKYTLKNADSKVLVIATDPYGNEYMSKDVITVGTDYPDYIVAPLKL